MLVLIKKRHWIGAFEYEDLKATQNKIAQNSKQWHPYRPILR